MSDRIAEKGEKLITELWEGSQALAGNRCSGEERGDQKQSLHRTQREEVRASQLERGKGKVSTDWQQEKKKRIAIGAFSSWGGRSDLLFSLVKGKRERKSQHNMIMN